MPAKNNPVPENAAIERAVLGACIFSPSTLENVFDRVNADYFYDVNNRTLWNIISDLYTSGQAVDFNIVLDEMHRRGVYDRLGGQAYIAEIVGDVSNVALASHNVRILHDYALRRRLLDASRMIAGLAYKYDKEDTEIIDEVERIIFEASESKDSSRPSGMDELSPSAFRKVEEAYRSGAKKFTGYSSGFDDLDKIVSGFQPGTLNVIAARPSMGKTALAMNIAQFGGDRDANPYVLVFSLEMPAEQLVHRMFAAQARVNVSAMNRGAISEDEFYRLADAAEALSTRNIYINDASDMTAIDFRTKCRRFKMRYPELALIIVDYIQLMRSGRSRTDNRQNEVAEISRSMKAVAIEMGCPVIALSQLSRNAENRTDKKPQLWDLRDSGAIEQDADTVILLYRESYYSGNENNNLVDDTADLRIAKNRNGGTGTCKLVFQREYTRFVGFAEEY